MTVTARDLAHYLRCPDDRAPLHHNRDRLSCSSCGRDYPVLHDRIVELLPERPLSGDDALDQAYGQYYLGEFNRPFALDPQAMAWGAPEGATRSWLAHRIRQVTMVRPLALKGGRTEESLLCDVTGGAGYYTLAYAPHFKYVLHCDLSVDALSYAYRKAMEARVDNVFFLRVDYFSLPLRGSVDVALCMDTLEHGSEHERRLLRSVRDSLSVRGHAIVDFHNWWHNPIRRIGLLPQNFGENRSYSRRQIESLLRDIGIANWRTFPFYQEFEQNSVWARVLSRIISPTRFVCCFERT